MKEENQIKTELVYCVVRYGTLLGCYRDFQDAVQLQNVSIQKGQICDLVVKPLL